MICFHHNDLDGRCSAAIVRIAFPDARCIEVDYASDIPFDEVPQGEEVAIVDFSLQKPGDWQKMIERAGHITWIDHHESAIKKAPPEVSELPGVRDVSKCGALLCWEFWIGQETPFVVSLVDAWDRWTHNDLDEVLNFVAGMKLENQSPTSPLWKTLLDYGHNLDLVHKARKQTEEIIENGSIIRAYEAKDNAEIVSHYSYLVVLDGHICLACNSNRRNSKVFDSVPVADRPEIFIAYVHDGQKFTVSLYSETVKVNDIAMKFGGGGHPGAAGFICEKLPWQ